MAEEAPDPKDKLVRDYYKRQQAKSENSPLAKSVAVIYALFVLLVWGGIGIILLLNRQLFLWGVLLLTAAALFVKFFLLPILKKPDYSKIKYKDVANGYAFFGAIGHNPLIIKFVKFGPRRPIVAIFAISIILATIQTAASGGGALLFMFGAFSVFCVFTVIYLIIFIIAVVNVQQYGPQDVKDFLKNDEVAPTGLLNPNAHQINLPFGMTAQIPQGWKYVQLLYVFLHKTKPEDVVKKAHEEIQHSTQKKYKIKHGKATLFDGKPTRKKSKAI